MRAMRIFRRRSEGNGVALADPPAPVELDERLEHADEDELVAEIEARVERNRRSRSTRTEVELMALRHLLGVRRMAAAGGAASWPEPDDSALPPFEGALPEVSRDALTPELLRAAILRDGCLLVRGLIDRGAALELADGIDRGFALRDEAEARGTDTQGYYNPFRPREDAGEPIEREWIKMGGGLLAVDSPKLGFDLLELFRSAGLPAVVDGYLGEPGLLSAQKTTLRKAMPAIAGAWHQDGKFLGEVRALNLWLSLSRCGDVAPGLDIVPRRLELVATQTDEAMLDYQVSQRVAEESAADRPIVRPIFEPGDALLFDDLCLHKTGSDPEMPNPRYAVESWFFGASGFPREYAPVAVS
jgi:hypothetical protein